MQSKSGLAGSASPAGKLAAPPEAQPFREAEKIVAQYNQDRAAARKQARQKIRELQVQVAAALKGLQDRYTRDAKLNEAVAIRDCIRTLKESRIKALPDPGTIHVDGSESQVSYFRVTGADTGPVWGTEVYTSDASLAAAAVHAGALKVGQTGVVKVTTIPEHPFYEGSFRNGIQSSSYGSYPGFTVERAGETEDDDPGDDVVEITLATNRPVVPVVPQRWTGFGYNGMRKPTRWSSGKVAAPVAAAETPAEAHQLVEQFDAQSASIWKDTNRTIGQMGEKAVFTLTPLQDALTREGKLDEAVAVRDCIQSLKQNGRNPRPGRRLGETDQPSF